MALLEADSILRRKDEKGNQVIMYPATKKDNIIDLEEATPEVSGLLPSSDKKKLDNIGFVFGVDENGIYMEEIDNEE